jgi:Tol biopolymer transport system component
MDVNEKTRKIAMSITYGGGDITGLWTMNLDGSELKQVVRPEWSREKLVGIDHPSWTPNGEKIVFAEIMRGMHPQVSHIAICNPNGTSLKYLQTGTSEDYYGQPSVSPDGKSIVYVLISRTMGGVWLMSLEGSNVRPLANPADKRKGRHSGRYPTWSSDGKKILLTGTGLIDAESGERISYQLPICDGKKYSWGWAHWSKSGIVGYNVSGLSYTDNDIKMLKRLGVSRSMECEGGVPCNW